MPNGSVFQAISKGKILAIFAAIAVVGVVYLLMRGGGEDLSLPPGFTITSGQDSGGPGWAGASGAGEETLEELIAASAGGEGDFQASIAILPLENRTGDTVFDTLGRGMADELIARLLRIRGLKVISRQSVQELNGLNLSTAEVADTLDVDHLLVGTAFPYEDAAQIQVRLLQVEGDTELWRNDYSVDRTNRMRAVEEISEEVGQALMEDVPSLSVRDVPRTTESHGYAAYLAGTRLLNTRTREGLVRAIDAFKSRDRRLKGPTCS